MQPVSFIVCSAGLGHRMKPVSQDIPKHLLIVKQKRLIEWSIDSIPFRKGDQLILVAQNNDTYNPITDALLKQYATRFDITVNSLYIDYFTRGQSATALLAEQIVKHSRIAIFNSDTYFQCERLDEAIHEQTYFGIVPCYKAPGSEWSFFKSLNNDILCDVIDVEEKIRISDWCSTGFYYFRDGNLFFEAVKNSLHGKSLTEELYVAPFYKKFLELGVKILDCQEFKPMGTPSQLERFWGISMGEMINCNGTP